MIAYVGRTDNAVSYNHRLWRIPQLWRNRYMADTEEEDIDEIELGASFPVGDTTIGVA